MNELTKAKTPKQSPKIFSTLAAFQALSSLIASNWSSEYLTQVLSWLLYSQRPKSAEVTSGNPWRPETVTSESNSTLTNRQSPVPKADLTINNIGVVITQYNSSFNELHNKSVLTSTERQLPSRQQENRVRHIDNKNDRGNWKQSSQLGAYFLFNDQI